MVAHRLVDLDVDVTTAKAASRGSQRPRRTMDRAVSRVSAVRHNSTAGAMYRFGVEARSTFGTRRATVQIRAARLGKPISARTLAARCGSPEGACQSVLSSTRVTHSGDHTMARSPVVRSPRAHWAMPHLESGWHTTTKGEGHDGMTSRSQKEKTPSQLIDERIKELDDWRGTTLSKLRSLVKASRSRRRGGMEMARRSDLVPRRNDLHRRNLQERGEDDLRQGCSPEGSFGQGQEETLPATARRARRRWCSDPFRPAVGATDPGRRRDSRPESIPSRRRPIRRAHPVRAQQGQGDAVEAEPEAARVGYLTAGGDDPERLPEVVEVAVRRGDRRGVLRGIDRRHNFVLERLRPLVLGENAADPPEEGVVRHHRLDRPGRVSRGSPHRAAANGPDVAGLVHHRRRRPGRAAGRTASGPGRDSAPAGNTSPTRRSGVRPRAGCHATSDRGGDTLRGTG